MDAYKPPATPDKVIACIILLIAWLIMFLILNLAHRSPL